MTNVSKRKLSKKTYRQLTTQLVQFFADGGERHAQNLFKAFFTDAEQIMFAKRLAIVLLLSENYSTYIISKTLKVSDSTVREIRIKFNAGHYDALISITRKKSFDHKKFWKTIEVLLQAGLPPRGRGRWKWLYEEK